MKIKIEKEEILEETESSEKEKEPQKERKKRKVRKPKAAEAEVSNSPLVYLGYFVVVVTICVLIALVARFIFIYQKSTFTSDGYAILIESQKPFIASYGSMSKRLTFLELKNFQEGDRIKESLDLGLPLDGAIKTPVDVSSENFSSYSLMVNMFFRQWSTRFENTTILDLFKLISSSMSVNKKDVEAKTVILSKDGAEGLTQDEIYDSFKDTDVINEGLSIEVINATDVEGLAGRAAAVIKNTGGNVISVTSEDPQKASQLIAANNSKTLVRISHLLGITPTINKTFSSQADVRVILGEDFAKNAP
ncbi:MAG: LytR C-terminal domain-containing protein [Candidatus Levyibacteriota bacterium]